VRDLPPYSQKKQGVVVGEAGRSSVLAAALGRRARVCVCVVVGSGGEVVEVC
jgi:hypothetical protein